MSDAAVQERPTNQPAPPPPPPDEENPAIIDAYKTFKITIIGAVLFCASALVIIFMTRSG